MIVIMTDLDGSLLDHHTYSYEEASSALQYLREKSIPIIFNSSKTASEIIEIQTQLDLDWPFVVENGAGIYLSRTMDSESNNVSMHSFGKPRTEILEILRNIRQKFGFAFTGFNDMTDEELHSHTNLSMDKILLAKQRDFSEPLLWQDNESQWNEFIKQLEQHELVAVKGGRFISITSDVNKADAVDWFKHHYAAETNSSVTIIALGDGENDIKMLNAADYGILIKSPAHTLSGQSVENLIHTQEFGPTGWNQSLLTLLTKIRKPLKS